MRHSLRHSRSSARSALGKQRDIRVPRTCKFGSLDYPLYLFCLFFVSAALRWMRSGIKE